MYKAKVTRPSFETGDKKVKLTATVSHGSVRKIKEFYVVVKKDGISDSQAVIKDLNAINIPSETSKNIELPSVGVNGSTITWESNNLSAMSNGGVIVRPDVGQKDQTVKLTATATKGEQSQEKVYTITVKSWTAEEEIEDAVKLVNWDFIKGNNSLKSSIETDLVLAKTVGRGVTITWKSSNERYCTTEGRVTRPPYTTGPITLTMTAELAHKEINRTVEISGLMIRTLEMTNEEIVERVKQLLQPTLFLGGNESLAQITSDMTLPVKIQDPSCSKAVISWKLAQNSHERYEDLLSSPVVRLENNPESVKAIITRPEHGSGNTTLALKATITVNRRTLELHEEEAAKSDKYFDITVLAKEEELLKRK